MRENRLVHLLVLRIGPNAPRLEVTSPPMQIVEMDNMYKQRFAFFREQQGCFVDVANAFRDSLNQDNDLNVSQPIWMQRLFRFQLSGVVLKSRHARLLWQIA